MIWWVQLGRAAINARRWMCPRMRKYVGGLAEARGSTRLVYGHLRLSLGSRIDGPPCDLVVVSSSKIRKFADAVAVAG